MGPTCFFYTDPTWLLDFAMCLKQEIGGDHAGTLHKSVELSIQFNLNSAWCCVDITSEDAHKHKPSCVCRSFGSAQTTYAVSTHTMEGAS